MTIILVFIVLVSAVAGWWLSHQRLASKPWLEVGMLEDVIPRRVGPPVAKVGLWMFLTIVTAVLAMLVSAFFMRIGADWRALPEPALLWFNSAVLIGSSVALQYARHSARVGELAGVKNGLLAGGVSALAFLVGQVMVWRQLHDAGHFLAGNPSVGFFYLLTAVHGVHLFGGIVALGRTAGKIWRGATAFQLRLSTELAAIYWHFLLGVWVVLFLLLLLTSRFIWLAQRLADIICGVPGG